MKPYFQTEAVTLYHGDCLHILPSLGGIDAVISDPPYGMNWDTDSTRFSGGQSAKIGRCSARGEGRSDYGPVLNDDSPFDPSPWINFDRVVLFGSNHFSQKLPVGTTLVWLKRHPELYGTFLSDAEIAWMKGGHGVYCYYKQFPPPSRMAECGGNTGNSEGIHPNQKPVGVMAWCMEMAKIPSGETVLDPYVGSGTTAIACIRTKRRFVGVEIDEAYCETAAKRIERELAQGVFAF